MIISNYRTFRHSAAGAALTGALVIGISGCSDSQARTLEPVTRTTIAESGASNPTVAVGEEGTTYVAWVATENGTHNVMFSRSGPDGSYEPPVRVNHVEGDAAPHAQAPAQVVVGPDGELYVAWQNKTDVEWLDFGASDVRLSRSTDGGQTWSPAITVNDNDEGTPARNTFHDLVVADDGTLHVSWIDARVRDGFRGEVFRQTGSKPASDEEPTTEVRVASSTDGGVTFGPSRVLETNSCPCCRTSTAVGPDGTVYVSYRKVYGDNIRDIAVARSTDGGRSFEAPVRVHEDNWYIEGCPHAGASLAVDTEGRLHVAWFTGNQEDPGAFYAVSTDRGRSFSTPSRLTAPGAVPTTQVALAADHSGTVWIAWEDAVGEEPQISLARVRDGGEIERMSVGAASGIVPALAASSPEVALAWLEGESVRVMEAVDD